MPAKHLSSDPSQSPTAKHDPTERRRLQNRLSQRNHRRKIRDRIAKLQERVIASELRAAATLHGWHSTPCIPYEVKPSASSTSSSSSSSSLSLSPSASASALASASSSPPTEVQYPSSSASAACSSCYSNINPGAVTPLPVLGGTAGFDESVSVSTTSSSNTHSLGPPDGVSPPTTLLLGHGGLPQGFGIDTIQMCEQWGFQGSVYLATETSLPQILSTLGPSSNAIILVPTGYAVGNTSANAGGLVRYTHTHTHTGQQSPGLDMTGAGACQCQCQGLGWIGCPVHMHSMG